MSGDVVQIGGEALHVVSTGSGRPVVLLSDGLGGAWFHWDAVASQLLVRSVRFDRPGLGFSPPSAKLSDLRTEADRLAAIAEAYSPDGPVVVVAHSAAAFHAEAFARWYPDQVTALVLVDPSCEPTMLPRRLPYWRPPVPLSGFLGPVLYQRMIRRNSHRGLSTDNERMGREIYQRPDVAMAVVAEFAAYRDWAADLRRLRHERSFPRIPAVVLTAIGDLSGERAADWKRLNTGLAHLLRADHIVLPDSLHMAHLDRPDAVAAAIESVLG